MTRLGRASFFVLSGSALVLGLSAGCSDAVDVRQITLGGAGGAGTSSAGKASVGGSSSGSSGGGVPNGGSGVTAGSGGGGSPGGSGGAAGSGGSPGGSGDAAGGTAGSSGGGTAGTGGGTAGTGGTSPSCAFLPVAQPMIYEFPGSPAEGGAGGGPPVDPIPGFSFGYNSNPPTVFTGYSFVYPDTLESNVAEGDWHVSGTVGTYAGFQVGFVCGADAGDYKGISFKISGNAGPSGSLSFVVPHAADVWRDPAATEPTLAKCMAPNQYDGTCQEAAATVQVTGTETTVSLLWEDIENGKPEMNPDPAELMGLR